MIWSDNTGCRGSALYPIAERNTVQTLHILLLAIRLSEHSWQFHSSGRGRFLTTEARVHSWLIMQDSWTTKWHWRRLLSKFLRFTPDNQHFITPAYSSLTVPWSVRYSMSGSTNQDLCLWFRDFFSDPEFRWYGRQLGVYYWMFCVLLFLLDIHPSFTF
jgi:hypothetical protein